MVALYQAHIEKVAEFLNCKLDLKPGQRGMMFVEYEPPTIQGPVIDEFPGGVFQSAQIKYITVLHELGHVFHGHTQGRPPFENKTYYFDNGVLKSEAEAWDYAMQNCIDEFEPSTLRFMRQCFSSYIKSAKQRGNRKGPIDDPGRDFVEFIYDKPTPYVVSVYEKMGGDKLDVLLYTHDEDIECNHDHNDMVLAAKYQGRKKVFRRTILSYSFPLKEDGSREADWMAPFEAGHLATQEELAEVRKQDVIKYVPLLLKERKGRKLLRKNIDDKQWEEYLRTGYFHVNYNGKRYLIYGYYGVQEMDKFERRVVSYCLHGKSLDLPQSDVLLIQKLMIETQFEEFEKQAHITHHIHREKVVTFDPSAHVSLLGEIKNIQLKNYENLVRAEQEFDEHETREQKLLATWSEAFIENNVTDEEEQVVLPNSIATNKFVKYRGE